MASASLPAVPIAEQRANRNATAAMTPRTVADNAPERCFPSRVPVVARRLRCRSSRVVTSLSTARRVTSSAAGTTGQAAIARPGERGTEEGDMSKKGGNKEKSAPKPPMANKGPKKK